MLPNGSHLAFGNYGEASRPLKRVLKQAGPSCCSLTTPPAALHALPGAQVGAAARPAW